MLKTQTLSIIKNVMGWRELTIPASRGIFVICLIISAIALAAIRNAQQVPVFDLPFIGLALFGAAALTVTVSRPTLRSKIAFLWIFAGLLAVILRTGWLLQTHGLLTGLGLLSTLDGPIFTGGIVAVLALIMSDLLIFGGIAAGVAGVATGVLVIILRSLQNLDPAWEPGTVIVIGALSGAGAFVTAIGLFDPRKLFEGEAGLPRATWMGIVGFLLGGLFVVVLRGLQNLDPLWEPGTGIVMTSIAAAAFFVWGMGAFDPKMSAHGEGHAEEAHAEEKEDAPGLVLGTYIWKTALWTLVVLLVIAFFAFVPGGPYLKQTANTLASPTEFGAMDFQLPFGGPVVQLSKLVLLIGFVLFTLISLAAMGGGLALLFYFLSRNVKEVSQSQPTPEELTPPEPIQALGRLGGGVAGWLQRELPKLLGQR